MTVPDEAVEAAPSQFMVPVTKVGCPNCHYNNKYGMIQCKEHRGW